MYHYDPFLLLIYFYAHKVWGTYAQYYSCSSRSRKWISYPGVPDKSALSQPPLHPWQEWRGAPRTQLAPLSPQACPTLTASPPLSDLRSSGLICLICPFILVYISQHQKSRNPDHPPSPTPLSSSHCSYIFPKSTSNPPNSWNRFTMSSCTLNSWWFTGKVSYVISLP